MQPQTGDEHGQARREEEEKKKHGSAEERKSGKNNLCESVKSVDTSLYRMMNDE